MIINMSQNDESAPISALLKPIGLCGTGLHSKKRRFVPIRYLYVILLQ